MLTFEQHITKLRITNAHIIMRSNISLMLSDVPLFMRYKLVADEYNFCTGWISGSCMIADTLIPANKDCAMSNRDVMDNRNR